MSTLGLYFHTVRYLRPVQIAARVWYRVHRTAADLRSAPRPRQPVAAYLAPVPAPQSLLAPDTFRFLNLERHCAAAADWSSPDVATLWTYNLHYFDDLNSRDSQAREIWHRELLERWVRENSPGIGVGWDSYPLSRRLVNWVKWAARGGTLPLSCQESLAVQARWLMGHLEYQILGNHLLVNAKALIHAGLYFDAAESQRWYERGMDIINGQVREQVLADGGHFELSPMYHALVMEDLLDLINLLRTYGRTPPAAWLQAVARMLRWLFTMSHPDGEIAFFNDAAFSVAPTASQLEAYANRLDLGPVPPDAHGMVVLPASGYVRASASPACLICDCAQVGPRYQPGHAHADTLSFELTLAEQRVLVNSGVSEYQAGPERQRQRGTAAHNTVTLNDEDSSEVWGAFRVARRARTVLIETTALTSGAVIEASHDGYLRLPGRNRHTRRWTLDALSLRVEDTISGVFKYADARFHLHPDIEARRGVDGGFSLRAHGRELAILSFEYAQSVQLSAGTWHPRFGVTVPNSCIVVRFVGATLVTQIRWLNAL